MREPRGFSRETCSQGRCSCSATTQEALTESFPHKVSAWPIWRSAEREKPNGVLYFVFCTGPSAAEARGEREEHRLHSWTDWGFEFQPCCLSDGKQLCIYSRVTGCLRLFSESRSQRTEGVPPARHWPGRAVTPTPNAPSNFIRRIIFTEETSQTPTPFPSLPPLCGPSPHVPVPFVLQPCFSLPKRAILQRPHKGLRCTHHRHCPPDSRERPVEAWKSDKAI